MLSAWPGGPSCLLPAGPLASSHKLGVCLQAARTRSYAAGAPTMAGQLRSGMATGTGQPACSGRLARLWQLLPVERCRCGCPLARLLSLSADEIHRSCLDISLRLCRLVSWQLVMWQPTGSPFSTCARASPMDSNLT